MRSCPDEAPAVVSSSESRGQHSPAAIGGLYREFAADLRAFLLGLLKDQHLADEVVQTTFAKAIFHYETIRNDNPRGWLFQVAYHEAMRLQRKRGVDRRARRGLAWLRQRTETGPEEPLIREEVVQRVRESLASLPTEQQHVVRRRIEDDQTFAQIAAESGVPLGTVLTRMRLALQKLQRQLTDLE